MDRAGALLVLQSIGLTPLMKMSGRTVDDTIGGYKPALDRAFAVYRIFKNDPVLATVAAADEYGFQVVLMATTYDLVMPFLAVQVDASVDAPLTSAKFSQAYRAASIERDRLWAEAALYGYGTHLSMGGWRFNLDFNEPSGTNGSAEYSH